MTNTLSFPAGHFKNAAEQIPYAQKRYNDESKRLLEVLEIRLKDHEYLVGGKYTIADLNAYTWCVFLSRASLRTEYNVG
jgi:glutathione S-transferase